MSNTYSVYKHTNKTNGKVYIGITVNEPEVRWGKNGKNYEKQLFGKAIRKYGWENFEHEILFENLSHKEANEKEIELIKSYKATDRDFGYNVALGGTDVNSLASSKTVYQYSLSGAFIQQYTSLVKAGEENDTPYSKIGACCRKGINHTSMGFRWSYEYLGEQIAWELMRNPNFYQEVYCYDLTGNFLQRYETATQAMNDTGIDSGAICGCYNGKTSNTKGLRWFKEYQGEKIEPLEYEINSLGQITIAHKLRNIKIKPVYQYSDEGYFLAKFDSARKAAQILNVKNLDNACIMSERYGYKTYGYYWSYHYYKDGFVPIKREHKIPKNSLKYYNTPVYQYDKSGVYVAEFSSVDVAAQYIGVKKHSIIQCCKNNRKCRGFYWSFLKEDYKKDIHINPQQDANRYLQFDLEHNFIAEYSCPQEAMEALSVPTINFKAKTSRGYIWKVIPKNAGGKSSL